MNGWTRFVVMCLAWALPVSAPAVEGLKWQWGPHQQRHYLIQANVRVPDWLRAPSTANKDLRLVEFYVAAITRCTHDADRAATKVVYLSCTFDDVQFRGAPPVADSDRGLLELLDEWDTITRGSRAQLAMTTDGKLRSLSLDGIDSSIRRQRELEEALRLVLLRAFAGLELHLPRKGDDHDAGWSQRDAVALQLVSQVGSFGSARIDTQVVGTQGTVALIRREGTAMISSGQTVGSGERERTANTYDMRIEGQARFDTAAGELVEQDYAVSGEPTASSVLASGTPASLYIQAVHVERIPEGATVAPLGPNAETTPGANGI